MEERFELGSAPCVQARIAMTLALPLPCIAPSLHCLSQKPVGVQPASHRCTQGEGKLLFCQVLGLW